MHAILVTFDSSANPSDLQEPFTEFAHALNQRSGFIMKTWVSRNSSLGGFSIFTDKDTADRYLAEMVEPVVSGNEAFTNLQVQHFDVLEGLSDLSGTPHVTKATAR